VNPLKFFRGLLNKAAPAFAPAIKSEEAPKRCGRCGAGTMVMTGGGSHYTCQGCGQVHIATLAQKVIDTHKCPDCGGDLMEGPAGGCSVNFKCSKDEHYFNISFLFGDILVERIKR